MWTRRCKSLLEIFSGGTFFLCPPCISYAFHNGQIFGQYITIDKVKDKMSTKPLKLRNALARPDERNQS